MSIDEKKKLFLDVFKKLEKKYKTSKKRLASDDWDAPWKTVIVTIMSAQSRDETTIPIAEDLFKKYPSVKKLSVAKYEDVLAIFKSLNYNRTKAHHVLLAAQKIVTEHKGVVPQTLEELITIPGVGRKTANLVLAECFNLPAICVDTHVHRISNVLGLVHTKTPHATELALQTIAPKKDWAKINRYFVLWGKDVSGRNKEKLLEWIE